MLASCENAVESVLKSSYILCSSLYFREIIHPLNSMPVLNTFSNDITQTTYSIGGDSLQPIIIQVKQNHLRFCSLQDEITKLLYLQTRLEW